MEASRAGSTHFDKACGEILRPRPAPVLPSVAVRTFFTSSSRAQRAREPDNSRTAHSPAPYGLTASGLGCSYGPPATCRWAGLWTGASHPRWPQIVLAVPNGVNPAARPIPPGVTSRRNTVVTNWSGRRDRGPGLTPPGTAKCWPGSRPCRILATSQRQARQTAATRNRGLLASDVHDHQFLESTRVVQRYRGMTSAGVDRDSRREARRGPSERTSEPFGRPSGLVPEPPCCQPDSPSRVADQSVGDAHCPRRRRTTPVRCSRSCSLPCRVPWPLPDIDRPMAGGHPLPTEAADLVLVVNEPPLPTCLIMLTSATLQGRSRARPGTRTTHRKNRRIARDMDTPHPGADPRSRHLG